MIIFVIFNDDLNFDKLMLCLFVFNTILSLIYKKKYNILSSILVNRKIKITLLLDFMFGPN